MNRKISTVMLSAFLLGLVSCSNPADTDPEGVVSKKAKSRWEDKIAGRDGKLYKFVAPSLKAIMSEQVYLSKFKGMVTYKKATLEKVKCDINKEDGALKVCSVFIDVTYQIYSQSAGVLTNTRTMEEKWVKEEGDWWFYDK